MSVKICVKCNETKDLTLFRKRNTSKDGRRGDCKQCDGAYRKARLSDPIKREKERQRLRDVRSNETPEQREYRLAQGREYAKKNPHILLKNTRKRQARILQATPEWAESEFEQFYIEEIYHLSALRKQMLGVEFNVDHIVPLQSKLVCGLHCASNLRILPATENKVKLNLHWPDMWQKEKL